MGPDDPASCPDFWAENQALGLDYEEMAHIVADLTSLNFFPSDPGGRTAVMKVVGAMAWNLDQVRYLVDRMLELYNEWPGPAEMRVCFCSRYRPRDGKDRRVSAVFDNGMIPPATPEPPAVPLLPPGVQASAEPALELSVESLARIRSLARPPGGRPRSVRLLPNPDLKPITAEDVERAEREYRQRKLDELARKELGE